MVASIGAVAAPSQGVSYYERDGYYAKDARSTATPAPGPARGAEALGLTGPVDPDVFTAILEGRVPDGPRLGRPGKDGEIVHRPGRDLTLRRPNPSPSPRWSAATRALPRPTAGRWSGRSPGSRNAPSRPG